MAYYYVKSGGTKTTGSTTKQTGTFAALGSANYYDNIGAVLSGNTIASGDFICVASDHTHNYGATTTLSGPDDWANQAATIVSVDVSNCESELSGAAEECTGSIYDLYLEGMWHLRSMALESDRNTYIGVGLVIAQGCTFTTNSAGFFIRTRDGTSFLARDCAFIHTTAHANNWIHLGDRAVVTLVGGSVNGGATASYAVYTLNGRASRFYAYGVDLSTYQNTLVQARGDINYSGADVRIFGCQLHSSVTFSDATSSHYYDQRLLISNSSATSAEAEYQCHISARGNEVNDETGIYRNESTAFPSGQKISLKCATTSSVGKSEPFWFDFPTRYAALSSTSTDNVTVYLTSNTQLYDSDVWVELLAPDGTNKHTYNLLTTLHGNVLDANGTELATDSGSDWRNGASASTLTYEYKIDLDTSAAGYGGPAADCVPIIRVYVAKASTTIYFCPTIGLS